VNVLPRGPTGARVLIVGEAPGAQEEKAGAPFVGHSGQELTRMLTEAGIPPHECRYTNVTNTRPPDNDISKFFRSSKKAGLADGATYHRGKWAMPVLLQGIDTLRREIEHTRPDMVIGFGNTALWACTGEWGITKWRGSQMVGQIGDTKFNFLPTYHPAYILRMWQHRWIGLEDLKRANKQWEVPEYDFLIRPSYGDCIDFCNQIVDRLGSSVVRISSDIETRNRQIACTGLATDDRSAICIPILCVENPEGYWTIEEETNIVLKLREIHTHPNAHIIGQNFIYDMQYFARLYGFRSNLNDDTMVKHHTCFPGTQKGLDFLSSIYCRYHHYWKDESKDWDPRVGEEQLWIYNCKDCCATLEANKELDNVVDVFGLKEQYAFQMRTNQTAFNMMLRGVLVDRKLKADNAIELFEAMIQHRDFIEEMLHPFTVFGPKGVSSQKMQKLAYEIMKLPPKFRTVNKKKRRTADKDAVKEWCTSVEPIFRPVLEAIREFRSLGVYKSTFADAPVDHDDRFRCSINVAGPETLRWSTATDAFGYGTNMQNIPKKREE
jgi:DNA polymerase